MKYMQLMQSSHVHTDTEISHLKVLAFHEELHGRFWSNSETDSRDEKNLIKYQKERSTIKLIS